MLLTTGKMVAKCGTVPITSAKVKLLKSIHLCRTIGVYCHLLYLFPSFNLVHRGFEVAKNHQILYCKRGQQRHVGSTYLAAFFHLQLLLKNFTRFPIACKEIPLTEGEGSWIPP
jgi:hypothetical protein